MLSDDLLFLSPKLKAKLESAGAQEFRRVTWNYCRHGFVLLFDYFPKYGDILRLEPDICGTAIDSAFLDLFRDEEFHELRNGPSPEKRAAAVTAWLNRLRPVQQVNLAPAIDHKLAYVNPLFALLVGLSLCSDLKALARIPVARDLTVDNRADITEILYNLHWRNPGYRQLTMAFRLAPFI